VGVDLRYNFLSPASDWESSLSSKERILFAISFTRPMESVQVNIKATNIFIYFPDDSGDFSIRMVMYITEKDDNQTLRAKVRALMVEYNKKQEEIIYDGELRVREKDGNCGILQMEEEYSFQNMQSKKYNFLPTVRMPDVKASELSRSRFFYSARINL
jgi:hypothetical protein